MLTTNDKRRYLARYKHHPLIIAGMLLKGSVCGVIVALLVVIGMQAPGGAFDGPHVLAQAAPHSFYVK